MRIIEPGTKVSFRTSVEGDIQRLTGTVLSLMPLREARSRGLVSKPKPDAKNPRKGGTVLEINAEITPGHHKLLYKHRSLVRVVESSDQKEEELKNVG